MAKSLKGRTTSESIPPLSPGEGLKPLDIRTKTIELTLLPIFQQITYLVNKNADSPSHQNHSSQNGTVAEVSSAVENAIKEFVRAGERVAEEYPLIRQQIIDACLQARESSEQILAKVHVASCKELISPIRHLLATMYKVLVLADSVIVQEIIQAKEKVYDKLDYLSKLTNFTDFLNNFSNFGAQMAEFGKLTGERQMDMKKELDAAKTACLRGFLEKSTVIYLTSCKICLRHPSTPLGRDIRTSVVGLMKKGLTEIIDIICYSACANTDDQDKILNKALNAYTDALEMCAILSGDTTSVNKAKECFSVVDEYVHEFTDSAYTPHQHRELIILTCQKCNEELEKLAALSTSSSVSPDATEIAIENCQVAVQDLRRQLIQHTLTSAAELFGSNVDTGLLAALKSSAQEGETDRVDNISSQIRDHTDQIQEISKQLQHVAPTDSFYIRVKYTANYLLSLTELLLSSAEVYSSHGVSKAAAEGYSTMADSWVVLIGELAAAAEELQESLYYRP